MGDAKDFLRQQKDAANVALNEYIEMRGCDGSRVEAMRMSMQYLADLSGEVVPSPQRVLEVAKQFEGYLRGE